MWDVVVIEHSNIKCNYLLSLDSKGLGQVFQIDLTLNFLGGYFDFFISLLIHGIVTTFIS